MLRKLFKKNRKLTAALTLGVCMAAAVPSAFALNVAGDGTGTGNKPFSFTGYQYLDNDGSADTLELNFNKDCTSPGEMTSAMFTVKDVSDNNVAISSVTISTNADYDGGSHYTKGSKALITFTNELNADALYTVTINGRMLDKNGLTLGNYANGKDLAFKFKTPDAYGRYTSTNPYVTYVVGDGTSNVSWESDLTVIFDRPFSTDPTKLANFKSSLNSGYTKGGNQVSLGDTAGSYEAYTVKSNDTNSVNTVFYFPETKNTSTSPVFNRSQSSNTYTLTLPGTFYDENDAAYTTGYTGGGSSYQFTTVSADYPGWEMNASTASGTNAAVSASLSGTTLTVGWYDTWVNPDPTGYKVYAIDSTVGNQYTDMASWTLLGTHTGHTDGQYESHNYTVTSGRTYYVRVVPYNATGSVGPSKAGNN